MNKLSKVVVASFCAVALSAVAEEEATTLEEEEAKVFEAGFDFDYFSAYVWHNAVQNDRMVMEPCVWGDLTYFDPFWAGFSIWQNYDLTDRRRESYRHGLTETDYNVHVGVVAWASEDGALGLEAEIGHEWYDNLGVHRDSVDSQTDSAEVYAKLTFKNPVVEVYGLASYMYKDFGDYLPGMYYELGFKREIDLCSDLECLPKGDLLDSLTLGADWTVGFGDNRYNNYIFGTPHQGFGGTTLKFYLNWGITEWVKLCGTIAYTGVINGAQRDSLADLGSDYGWDGDNYARDLLWGGVSLKFEF